MPIGSKPPLMPEASGRTAKELELFDSLRPIWSAASFDSALKFVLRAVGRSMGWFFAEAWLPDQTETMLKLSPVWFGIDPQTRRFHKESKHVFAPKGVGLCGRVWESGEPEWIADLSTVPAEEFLRSELAAQCGLGGGYAVPVIGGSKVLAVLIFFSSSASDGPRPDVEGTLAATTTVSDALYAMLRAEEAAVRQQELSYDSQSTAMCELVSQIVGDVIPLLTAITEWSERCSVEILRLDVDASRRAAIALASQATTSAARRARGLMRRLEPLIELSEDAAIEEVDVNAVARKVLSALRPAAPRGISLRAQLDPSIPGIQARLRDFEMCIFCLVQNAIEAVARSEYDVKEVSIKTAFRDGSIEIQVHDTGCGLTPIVAENMGSPLFSTKKNGLGMGLVIARKVIESIGGRLSGEANPDHGATFRIALPV